MIQLDFGAVLADWPLLLRGAAFTLALTAVASALGLALGCACARARTHGSAPVRVLAAAYVEAIRNTPFIVQLFFIFFGLPSLGLRLSSETASLIAMTLNLGAYAAEIVRAGIESTPRGQLEAARSLAMTEGQVFRKVVLPPSLGRVWPAMVSQIVIVMLGSAVVSQISVPDLTYAASYIQSRNFRSFETYLVITVSYLGLAIALRAVLKAAGRRFFARGAR